MNLDFNKWIDDFLIKKKIDLDKTIKVNVNDGSYKIEVAALVLHIKNSKETMQKIYQKRLQKLSLVGADIVEVFFKELAVDLIPNLFKK